MLYEAHGISKFIVVCGYTDLRKGITGLAQIIEGNFRMDPFEKANDRENAQELASPDESP